MPKKVAGGGERFPPTWTNSVLLRPTRESNGEGDLMPKACLGVFPRASLPMRWPTEVA